jgi:hypothetical protein
MPVSWRWFHKGHSPLRISCWHRRAWGRMKKLVSKINLFCGKAHPSGAYPSACGRAKKISAEEITSPLKNVFGKTATSRAARSALCSKVSRSVNLLCEELIIMPYCSHAARKNQRGVYPPASQRLLPPNYCVYLRCLQLHSAIHEMRKV